MPDLLPWPTRGLPLHQHTHTHTQDNSDKHGDTCAACHIPPCDCGFQMSVERLNPGYTSSSLENSGWIGVPRVEAPAMFKRGAIYYLLFDRLSCFGPQGSGAVVYTATSPLGPYAAQGNINRHGPFRPYQLGFIIVPGQQTYVAEVDGTFVWMADLWDSYTDEPSGKNVKVLLDALFRFWPRLTPKPRISAVRTGTQSSASHAPPHCSRAPALAGQMALSA